jgi:hypothetical protein
MLVILQDGCWKASQVKPPNQPTNQLALMLKANLVRFCMDHRHMDRGKVETVHLTSSPPTYEPGAHNIRCN